MSIGASFTGIGAAPSIASVTLISSQRIRVAFSEGMSPSGAILVVGSYALTASGGSAACSVAGVVLENTTAPEYVVLLLDQPTTQGSSNYTLTVSSALVDLAANALTGTLSFTLSGIASSGTRTFAQAVAARDADWIALCTIEGSGSADGTQYRYCSRVPPYAEGDPSYRPWLVEWPSATAERINEWGGVPEAGEIELRILDYDDRITAEWRTDAPAIAFLAADLSGAGTSATVTTVGAISAGAMIYVGNEALAVTALPGGSALTVERAQLDTEAVPHASGTPVYAHLPYVHSRRVRLRIVNADAGSSLDEYEIGVWRVDYRGLSDDLNAVVLRGQTELRWLGRLTHRRPIESYELLSWRESDWQGRLRVALPSQYDLTASGKSFGGRHLWLNTDTRELFSAANAQTIVGQRALYDSVRKPMEAGHTVLRVFGADPDDDPDYPTSYFRWSPGASPSSSRTSGTWIRSCHWIDIILNLAVSSAHASDGLELANRDTDYGAWDCLPVGVGIGLPHSMIDWDAALDVRSRTPDYLFPNFWIGEESVPFGELITDHFLRPIGAYLSTSSGRARIILPRVPLQGDGVVELGAADILAHPIGTGLFEHDITIRQDMSDVRSSLSLIVGPREDRISLIASDYGSTFGQVGYYAVDDRPEEIKMPSARVGRSGRLPFLEARAMGRLLRRWRPLYRISLGVGAEHYARQIGQGIEIDHEQLPDHVQGVRGGSAIPAELTQISYQLNAERGYVHRWEALTYGPWMRAGRIAPSARIESVALVGGQYQITVSANRYTASDAWANLPGSDAEAFAVGDVLLLYSRAGALLCASPGDLAVVRQIGSNTLTVSTDFGGALGLGGASQGSILRYIGADDSRSAQTDVYVHWADTTNRDVGTDGSDAWRYGEP